MTDSLRPVSWPSTTPFNLSEIDHEAQRFCVEMHKNGIYVDQDIRANLEILVTGRYKKREKILVDIMRGMGLSKAATDAIVLDDSPDDDDATDDAPSNPGSCNQIREILFSRWELSTTHGLSEKEFRTKGGLEGTGDKVLRALLASDRLTPEQDRFISELRLFRREKNKLLGSTLIPMQRRRDHKRGLAWDDGRVRSTWNAHTVANARLSSSKPNFQNQSSRKGGFLKAMYTAAPGHILIGADLAQAHLYIVANYWRVKALQEMFALGQDPHTMLSWKICQQADPPVDFTTMDGWAQVGGFHPGKKPEKKTFAHSVRESNKTSRYTGLYGAGVTLKGHGRIHFKPDTIAAVVRATEEPVLDKVTKKDTGNVILPYRHYKDDQIIAFHRTWMAEEPELIAAWEYEMSRFETQGWVDDPVFLRRSGGLSDGKFNEVVNYPILTAEAHIMRLAEWNVRQAFPFEFAGPGCGIIQQVHDQIVVEIPLPKGFDPLWAPTKGEPLPPELERQQKLLEECMQIRIPGWELAIPAEGGCGRSLADV